MSLCANANDPCLVGPVFTPPTDLSFRSVDAAPSGKTNVPKAYLPWQQIVAEEQQKLFHHPFSW